MSQVIIYKQDNGTVSVVRPTDEALALIGIDTIAKKDVPAGSLYKIISDTDIPADIAHLSHLFDVADTDLTDGAGALYGNGTPWGVIGYGDTTVTVIHASTGEVKEVPK